MADREAGVVVVVWRRAPRLEVLLLHRSHFGGDFEGDWAWTTPGGTRAGSETPTKAAARELLEETGLTLALEPVDSKIAADQHSHDVAVFAAEASAHAEVVLSDEHDRYEWVGAEDLTRCLPSWVHSMYYEVLAMLALV